MRLQLRAGARAAWQRHEVPMTMLDEVTQPAWPVILRRVWIESPDPETHRVAQMTRAEATRAGGRGLPYLDRLDELLLGAEISFV